MTTVLITGINGFAGRHLAAHLLSVGADVSGTVLHGGHWDKNGPFRERVQIYTVDVRHQEPLREILERERPDRIYHLAGISFVKESWDDPMRAHEINFLGTFNLLEAMAKAGLSSRILFAGSAEVYGPVDESALPMREDLPFRPITPYAVSKAAGELIGMQYAASGRLEVLRTRAFNHIGPGQDDKFVCSSFARQIAEIEAGKREPVIRVGNLEARRDFTDVRDVVRAYHAVMEHGTPGEVYNVCSGEAHSIQSILERMLSLAKMAIEIRVDQERFRPVDIPVMMGDNAKLASLGWKRAFSLESSLKDILNDWRERVRNG